MVWWWRRKDDDKTRYEPRKPKDGYDDVVPSAIYRKLQQIKRAMLAGDDQRVRRSQQCLMRGGWEIPTTPDECDEIETRLRKRAVKATH